MATSSPRPDITFRGFLTGTSSAQAMRRNHSSGSDRLHARPAPDPPAGVAPGTSELGGGALLRVPPTAAATAPLPLVVLFHGAGSSAGAPLGVLAGVAGHAGLMLLAPPSRASTGGVLPGGLRPRGPRPAAPPP